MLLKIKNLGSINQAEIDLDKALILLCGEHDSWQNYLTYTIYHLYSFDTSIFLELTKLASLEDTTQEAKELMSKNKLEIKLLEKVDSYFLSSKYQILEMTALFLKQKLAAFFESENILMPDTEIALAAEDEFIKKQITLSNYETHFGNMQKGYFLTAHKPTKSDILTFEVSPQHQFTPDRLASAIALNTFISMVHSLLGVQPQVFEPKQKFVANSDQEVKDLAEKTSPFAYLAEKLAQISPDFQSLIFYLRHLAQPKDLLIIRQPEKNLYIDNQVLMGNFIGNLVNQGFKVVTSTNSIPLVEEIKRMTDTEQNEILATESTISLFFTRKIEWAKFSNN
ncbi:MAG: hypothetical protein EAZ08_09675 [Cytophagales bacterium]|nr:MAG: hypothetical protein EAZ08_09675 [Cytophagales bacterium]